MTHGIALTCFTEFFEPGKNKLCIVFSFQINMYMYIRDQWMK